MARKVAHFTGIDVAPRVLASAKLHLHVSGLDFDYQDEMSAVQTADAFTGSSNRVNLNTGFGNDNWRITLWAYNLLENETATSGVYLPNPVMAPDVFVFGSRPGFQVFQGLVTGPQLRSYGLTLKYDF